MIIKHKKFFINNIIFWTFFSSIFLDYIIINKIYYMLYFITAIIFLYDFIKYRNVRYKYIIYDKKIFFTLLFFIFYTLTISIFNFKVSEYKILLKSISIYLLCIYIYFKLVNILDSTYIINFYKLFAIIMNFFSTVNLVEIINKKSLFYNFIASDSKYWQVSLFGTQDFRTYSIFIHPIIYSVFLVILFWCNKFIIKNSKIKFIANFIVIINLFFTKSRSSWIAFIIIIIIYYLKYIIYKMNLHKIKISYKNLLRILIIILFSVILIIIFSDSICNILEQIIQRFITITNDSYGDISRLQRLGTIKLINNYMINNGLINFLFGNGLGSVKYFMMNNKVFIDNFSTTDNQYLSIFYETGFIGLAGYILIFIIQIIKFFKNSIDDIGNLPSICFLIISIAMFFFEAFGWTDVFIFLAISVCFSIPKYNK